MGTYMGSGRNSGNGIERSIGVAVAMAASALLYWSLLEWEAVARFLITQLGDGDAWVRLPDEWDVAEQMARSVLRYAPSSTTETTDGPHVDYRGLMRDLSKLFSDVNPMLGSERSFRGYAIRFYTARISPQEFGSLTDADTWWEWFLGIRSPEALLNLASICVCQCTLVLGCLALLAILFRSEGYEERLVRVISSAWFRFYQLCFLAVVHELLSALYCGVSWLYYHPDYWSIFSGNLVLFVLGCLIGVVGWLVLTILGLCWTIFVRFVAVTAVEIAVLLPAAVCLPLHVVLCHVYGLLG